MKDRIAYCGLDCEKCDAYLATINDDQALREKTAKRWAELNNAPILPEHINCEGCRVDGIKTVYCDSLCGIRQCALKKGVATCGDCPDLEICQTVGEIIANNPDALKNLRGQAAYQFDNLQSVGTLNREQTVIQRENNLMKQFSREAEQIMIERFGKDTIIALATTENEMPYVRYVNAYYEDGAFYIITYALSNKMKHIKENPVVAIAGEWFTAHGKGASLGYFRKKENCVIAEKLKKVFAEWIDNGHTDLNDENTIILRVELTDGLLLLHGTRYEF